MGAATSTVSYTSDHATALALSNVARRAQDLLACPLECIPQITPVTLSGFVGPLPVFTQRCTIDATCFANGAVQSLAATMTEGRATPQARQAAAYLGLNADQVLALDLPVLMDQIAVHVARRCRATPQSFVGGLVFETTDAQLAGPIVLDRINNAADNCAFTLVARAHAIADGSQPASAFPAEDVFRWVWIALAVVAALLLVVLLARSLRQRPAQQVHYLPSMQ